jgi:hypothetical protein
MNDLSRGTYILEDQQRWIDLALLLEFDFLSTTNGTPDDLVNLKKQAAERKS